MLVDRGFKETKTQDPAEAEHSIYEELGELTKYVEMMTRTIGEMETPVTSTSDQLPQATAHLGELAKITEDGTHKVMTLTDEIGENRSHIVRLLGDLQNNLNQESSDVVAQVLECLKADETRLTNITVALSFQDIVAQRVAKLVTVLEEVQHKLLKLVVVFGIQKDAASNKPKDGRGYEMLKQLESSKTTALEQDLVDDILSEFGFN